MSNYVYFPIIKTRDAELRCFNHIKEEDFNHILPIYELTKSRITKKAPDGDIYRRMKQISEIQGDKPFILDLSTDDRYINPQIEQLLSQHEGFSEWQYFVFDLHRQLNIIPMIHLYEGEDGEFEDVKKFVKEASTKITNLAVRLPYDLEKEEIEYYLTPIVNSLNEHCKLFVILDADYIRADNKNDVVDKFLESISGTSKFTAQIKDVVMICTSFPSNVAQTGGEDRDGRFDIYEEEIYQRIIKEESIKYGDYVSINTEQIEMKGGTFVPRIDIVSPDGKYFVYKRYRRHDNGYIACAKQVVQDGKPYQELDIWANEEINHAASEKPSGISPAFWISVRMNYYLKTKINLRLTPPR